jgi:quinoprotein glucose dehydrogenase
MALDTGSTVRRRAEGPMVLVTALAVLALLDSLFNYVWQGNGIHGTEGALLVIISTLLLAIAGWLVAARWVHGGVRLVLEILIFLDLIGTGVAAYFLNAWILVALDVIALLVFLFHVLRRRPATVVATSG